MPPKKETKSTGTLLTDMAHDSDIRTSEKSKKLQSDYVENLEDLEDRIDEKLAENKQAVSAIRQDQLTRLLALSRKRCAIETAIADSHAKLHQSYEIASKELRRSIKFRADEIRSSVQAATASGEEEGEGEEGGEEGGEEEEGEAGGSGEDKENEAPPGLKGGKGRSLAKRADVQDLMEGGC